MSVAESRRLVLYEQTRSSLGDQAASTLMDLLPTDVDQLATRGDLRVLSAELRAEMHQGFARNETSMAELQRTLIVAFIGIMLTGIALTFAAARLG